MVAAYLSLLSSISEKPLEYWCKRQPRTGQIRKVLDADLLENVIEIQDYKQPNTTDTSILCPPNVSELLNIELPILVIVIKNLRTQCHLQIQVVDDRNCSHHFQFYEGELEKRANQKYPIISRVKVDLESGWNNLELDLADLTQAVFKCQYKATQRLEIGGCRLRRVYFLDRHYQDQEISPELYQGFLDLYMLKWGIRSVDRSTQTCARQKSKVTDGSLKRTDKRKLEEQLEIMNLHLLSNLKIKSEKVIDDFFGKQPSKALCAVEFKRLAKLKPYAVPMKNAVFERRFLSKTMFDRINSLQNFTGTCN